MHTDFVDFPNPIEIIQGITTWSNPFFQALLPYISVSLGLIIAALITKWLGQKILDGLDKMTLDWKIAHHLAPPKPLLTATGAQGNYPVTENTSDINHPMHMHVTRPSIAHAYFEASKRGDKKEMERLAKLDSYEQTKDMRNNNS